MRVALRSLDGIRRSIGRLVSVPRSEAPDFEQAALLRLAAVGPDAGGDAGAGDSDEALAVAFFGARPAGAGFLDAAEAEAAVANYAGTKPHWRQALLEEAMRFCQWGLPIYALQGPPLGAGFDWDRLARDRHDDRLYVLRPHRFGFLPRLAIAACLGAACLPALHATLDNWIARASRTGGGADAYFSNLVVIYRILAVSWAAPFLAARAGGGDTTAAAICLQLFRILAADTRHLLPRLGESAPNNHLLADRFAAWFLAACYPELTPGLDLANAERAWHDELQRQFQGDGSNFEQSLHYHELGCEMALIYLLLALRRGTPPEKPVLMRLGRMLRFQAALVDSRGNGFALGDATDDPLLPLDGGDGLALGAWRVLYRTLFDPTFPDTGDEAAGAERAFWLLACLDGLEQPTPLVGEEEAISGLAAFPDNGYLAFRDGNQDACVLFRTGPRPGASPCLGHAMSDLLTVYWNAAGRRVLEPAGTYSYAATMFAPSGEGADASPRQYFRSPAAHNGLVLEGHDPLGRPSGRFRGPDKGTRVASSWQGLDGVLGWAEGQVREDGPLSGYQRGVVCLPGLYTLVYDRLPTLPTEAVVAFHWQLAPEVEAIPRSGNEVSFAVDGLLGYFCASEGVAPLRITRGLQAPPAGWVSRRYGELTAAAQLRWPLRADTQTVAFVFGLEESGSRSRMVRVLLADDEGVVVALQHGACRDVVAVGHVRPGMAGLQVDLSVQARVLWLRMEGERCRQIRALGLRALSSEKLGLRLVPSATASGLDGWRCVAGEASAQGISGLWEPTPGE